MDFDRVWTQFALDAEVEHFGTGRIARAHNALRSEVAGLKACIEELKREIEHQGQLAWNRLSDAEKDAAIRDTWQDWGHDVERYCPIPKPPATEGGK